MTFQEDGGGSLRPFPSGKLSCGCSFMTDGVSAVISPCKKEGHTKSLKAVMQIVAPQATEIEELYKVVPTLKED